MIISQGKKKVIKDEKQKLKDTKEMNERIMNWIDD